MLLCSQDSIRNSAVAILFLWLTMYPFTNSDSDTPVWQMKAEGMSARVFKVTLCETVSVIPFRNNLDEVQIPSIVIRKWERARSWQSYPKRITILLYLLTTSADCLNLLAINPYFIVQLCWTGKSITGITAAASNSDLLYCHSWLHWFCGHDWGRWIPPFDSH